MGIIGCRREKQTRDDPDDEDDYVSVTNGSDWFSVPLQRLKLSERHPLSSSSSSSSCVFGFQLTGHLKQQVLVVDHL